MVIWRILGPEIKVSPDRLKKPRIDHKKVGWLVELGFNVPPTGKVLRWRQTSVYSFIQKTGEVQDQT